MRHDASLTDYSRGSCHSNMPNRLKRRKGAEAPLTIRKYSSLPPSCTKYSSTSVCDGVGNSESLSQVNRSYSIISKRNQVYPISATSTPAICTSSCRGNDIRPEPPTLNATSISLTLVQWGLRTPSIPRRRQTGAPIPSSQSLPIGSLSPINNASPFVRTAPSPSSTVAEMNSFLPSSLLMRATTRTVPGVDTLPLYDVLR